VGQLGREICIRVSDDWTSDSGRARFFSDITHTGFRGKGEAHGRSFRNGSPSCFIFVRDIKVRFIITALTASLVDRGRSNSADQELQQSWWTLR
jgi:hypothetical protein